MQKQKELISYLKQMSNNHFTVVVLITTGIMGLFFTNISIVKLVILLVTGIFFDILYLMKYSSTNKVIEKIIKEIK